MPEVGEVMAALQQALDGLGKAQSASAQVDARAQQIQSRAAGNGFRGIAERAGVARARLKRIREMEAEVATTVESTVDVVQRVTTDMSPADVVSTLTPASQQMGSASNGISVLIAELDGLKSEIAEALRGGQPGPLVGLLDLIRRGLIEVMASLGAANQRTDETIAEARQTGNF